MAVFFNFNDKFYETRADFLTRLLDATNMSRSLPVLPSTICRETTHEETILFGAGGPKRKCLRAG